MIKKEMNIIVGKTEQEKTTLLNTLLNDNISCEKKFNYEKPIEYFYEQLIRK